MSVILVPRPNGTESTLLETCVNNEPDNKDEVPVAIGILRLGIDVLQY